MKTDPDDATNQGDMDWNNAHQQKTNRARSRAIVSVAFSRQDFERLDRHVERKGVKISEFIREAALDRVTAEQVPAAMSAAFAAAGYYAPQPKSDFPQDSGTAVALPSKFVQVA